MMKVLGKAAALGVALLLQPLPANAGDILSDIPEQVDPSRRYLFYMHGAWIELHGLKTPHPQHGLYEYDRIVEALAAKGFVVITQVRQKSSHPMPFAQSVASQVEELLRKGVAPEHVTVAGHSKGGHMALIVSSLLGQTGLNFVILAGCGKPGTEFRASYEKFLSSHARSLAGRVLSLYDPADREAGSCKEAFAQAPGLENSEIVLRTGRGHGLFYAPRSEWIDEVVKWVLR